ncbi:MAG: hypothetical protein M3Y87_27965 [Myxococcota bacterium]|nr:hypothetical protein [Myxococcota bacterium]
MSSLRSSLASVVLVLASGCACGAQVHVPRDAAVADTGALDASLDDAAVEDAASTPDATVPADAAIPAAPTRLIATFRASCLLDDATQCWGASPTGVSFGDTPQPAPDLDGALDVKIGLSFLCALRADGRVECAGSNHAGQLGVSPDAAPSRAALEPVPGLDDVVELALDGAHACALRSDGTVWCWGDNSLGAVGRAIRPHGLGASVPEPVPMPVAGLGPAIGVAAGVHHSCAALADGTIACWGHDSYGQLGRGAVGAATSEPVAALGLDDAIAIDARGNSTCALRADGTAWCWGRHSEGQLGIAAEDVESCTNIVPHPCATAPRRVVGVEGARALAFGGVVGCALTASGGRCWGTIAGELEPDVVEVAAGWEHVCARSSDDRVRCRGRGDEGQLGDGTATDRDDWVDAALSE